MRDQKTKPRRRLLLPAYRGVCEQSLILIIHSAHGWRRCCRWLFFRFVEYHAFCSKQHSSYGGCMFQGYTRYLGRVYYPGCQQVLILFGACIETVIILVLFYGLYHYAAFEPAVVNNLA